MKKLITLTKTLLVLAGLCVGVNAWAETQIFTEDFSGSTYNVTWGGTKAGGVSPDVVNGVLTVANGSQSGDRSAYVAFGSNAYTGCCRLTFDMAMTKSNWSGKNNNFYILPSATTDRYPSTDNAALIITQASDGAITAAGESVGKYDGTMLTYDLYLNTISGEAKLIIKEGESEVKTITYATTATGINTLHLTFNKNYGAFAIDNISFYSLVPPSFTLSSSAEVVSIGGTTTVDVSDITGTISVSSDNESAATASYENGTVTITGVASGVANIKVKATNDGLETAQTIAVTVGEVAKTTVTVNYLCGETPIADPLLITDVAIGSNLTAADITYDAIIYGEGVRYVNPELDQALPYTVVENGVINVLYTSQAAVTNIKKIVKIGDDEFSNTNVALEGKYVGDVIQLPYSLYILRDGSLYSKAANSSTYSQSFTLTENDQECVFVYSATAINNVVYFSEGEDIDGATATSAGGNMPARSSNQQCGYAPSDITLINLPSGTYQATIVYYSNSSAGIKLYFNFGGTDYTAEATGASNWLTATKEFGLGKASDIVWEASGNNKNGVDFIYIQKIADPQTATIGAAGYATFSCSDKALDFTNTDVKAYTASLNSDYTVLLTPVKQVPANTGLVLAGAQGTYDIPVITEAAAITGNLLKPSADEVIAASTDDLHHYVLAKRGDNVGFYNLAAAKNIGAGKAYLETTDALATTKDSRVAWIFADGTTGIKTTNLTNDTNETIYNLNGQRVAAPQKGLYIVNGKKVIMK